jgi:hypothetical protein
MYNTYEYAINPNLSDCQGRYNVNDREEYEAYRLAREQDEKDGKISKNLKGAYRYYGSSAHHFSPDPASNEPKILFEERDNRTPFEGYSDPEKQKAKLEAEAKAREEEHFYNETLLSLKQTIDFMNKILKEEIIDKIKEGVDPTTIITDKHKLLWGKDVTVMDIVKQISSMCKKNVDAQKVTFNNMKHKPHGLVKDYKEPFDWDALDRYVLRHYIPNMAREGKLIAVYEEDDPEDKALLEEYIKRKHPYRYLYGEHEYLRLPLTLRVDPEEYYHLGQYGIG